MNVLYLFIHVLQLFFVINVFGGMERGVNGQITSDVSDVQVGRVDDEEDSDLPQCGSPIFNPPGGDFDESVTVLINPMLADALVFITRDGSPPSRQNSEIFVDPITFGKGKYTLTASLFKEHHCRLGNPITMVYHVKTKLPEPEILLEDGASFQTEAAVDVKFDTSDEIDNIYPIIRYSLNGIDPTEDSNEVFKDKPIVIDDPGTFILKIKAFHNNFIASAVVSKRLTVLPAPPKAAFHPKEDDQKLLEAKKVFDRIKKNNDDEYFHAGDLYEYILQASNPDQGRCDGCHITDEEREHIAKKVETWRKREGLIDDDMVLHFGFVSRGSIFRFLQDTNHHMHRLRRLKEEL